MATLLLKTAGTFVGGLIGGPVGAVLGGALGAASGGLIDNALFAKKPRQNTPSPRGLEGLTSPIPKLYGKARLGGQIIWATRFLAQTQKQRTKGGGALSPTTRTTTYSANLAIALCEGEIAHVRQIWADGQPLDTQTLNIRVYKGSQTQSPDPLIIAVEGAQNAPAFKGTAYVVIENLPLSEYGNRIPQFNFEVIKPTHTLNEHVGAVNLIPGAGEFVYEPTLTLAQSAQGVTPAQNRHVLHGATDIEAALDDLQALFPNLQSVQVVVSWFGSDLRAGQCTFTPRVETQSKTTVGGQWLVSGQTRESALPVSQIEGRPAFGGTPSDPSVLALISSLKARSLKVVLYPFIMMDIPATNTLPNPYSSQNGQEAYPWRGTITTQIAPTQTGTTNKTSTVDTEKNALFGSILASAFTLAPNTVLCTSSEWSYRRFILHYAKLAQLAGGVDGFIMGSELVGLTRLQNASNAYPFVQGLITLAQDVKALLPTSTLTYAADWSEYGAHVQGGGANITFPLDSLWANAAIDAVGIDFYPPLSDYRTYGINPDSAHTPNAHTLSYLANGLSDGEAHAWYYASEADRQSATRTVIEDGAYNEPWVYRAKDLKNWWQNAHHPRTNGTRETTPSASVPQSKPIWLTEFGCPAVHLGANSPNIFPDSRVASRIIPFSQGTRDDAMLMHACEALFAHFNPAHPLYLAGNNPPSNVYASTMIDPAQMALWAYDARPFPAFPNQSNVWADSADYQSGHWLNGRIEGASLGALINQLLSDFDCPEADVSTLAGHIEGYVIDKPMSARAALEPLLEAFAVHCAESGNTLRFAHKGQGIAQTILNADLLEHPSKPLIEITRKESASVPATLTLTATNPEAGYQKSTLTLLTPNSTQKGHLVLHTPLLLSSAALSDIAHKTHQTLQTQMQSCTFALPQSFLHLEVGDKITLEEHPIPYEITRIEDGLHRTISAQSLPTRPTAMPIISAQSQAQSTAINLPSIAHVVPFSLTADTEETLLRAAVFASPWVSSYALYSSHDGYENPLSTFSQSATIGQLLSPLNAGALYVWDNANEINLTLNGGALSSATSFSVLGGANVLAVQSIDGAFEVLQFAQAQLISPNTYKLTQLLRGQQGTEKQNAAGAAAGANCLLLNDAVQSVITSTEWAGLRLTFKIVPLGQDVLSPLVSTLDVTPTLGALKPLSPVHLKAYRQPNNDLLLSWVRRTRKQGDGWEQPDVPIGEETLSFGLKIYKDTQVVRQIQTLEASYLYTQSDRLTDFTTEPNALTIEVWQNSTQAGQGHTLLTTLSL